VLESEDFVVLKGGARLQGVTLCNEGGGCELVQAIVPTNPTERTSWSFDVLKVLFGVM
jgi:hypothetical protein